VTPHSAAFGDRDAVLMTRYTDCGYRNCCAGIALWDNRYAIDVVDDGVNTKLVGVGSAADILPDRRHALRFAVRGLSLILSDNGREVLSVVDPTLVTRKSYVGLQSSTGTGRTSFANVSVRAL
jgi:hypothetical protein